MPSLMHLFPFFHFLKVNRASQTPQLIPSCGFGWVYRPQFPKTKKQHTFRTNKTTTNKTRITKKTRMAFQQKSLFGTLVLRAGFLETKITFLFVAGFHGSHLLTSTTEDRMDPFGTTDPGWFMRWSHCRFSHHHTCCWFH